MTAVPNSPNEKGCNGLRIIGETIAKPIHPNLVRSKVPSPIGATDVWQQMSSLESCLRQRG